MPRLKPRCRSRQRVRLGDCRDVLAAMPENRFTAVVTDPPYGLKFMGKDWDRGVPGVPFWEAIKRVAKPGAFLLAFGGTRTHHRLMCAIEDAGWEIRDCLMWVYGQGFPKSHDISKAIDKAAGHWRGRAGAVVIESQPAKGTEYERTPKGSPVTAAAAAWDGYGTALKPAWEPIIVAMKPLDGTFTANALEHGVAGLNIDGCRISTTDEPGSGRWPANLIHDGSDEVVGRFKEYTGNHYADNEGSAARFFYCAKVSKRERTAGGKVDNRHPTVKPLSLMEYLIRLVTYPGRNLVLDPFCGSGSTLMACRRLGIPAVGIDSSPEAVKIAVKRLGATCT